MTKRDIEPIDGKRVRLRLLAEPDLAMTLAWRNQDRIRRWFINSDHLTVEGHRRWFEQYVSRDDDFVFIVEETEELLKPVGQVAIYNIDWKLKRAEYGRMLIGEAKATGRGLAQEATALAVAFAFSQLGLKELEAYILSSNAASLAVLAACGFGDAGERDGLRRVVVKAPVAER